MSDIKLTVKPAAIATATGKAKSVGAMVPDSLTGLFLRDILLLRLFAIGGQILAVILAYRALDLMPPYVPIGIVITLLGSFTWFSWQQLRSREVKSERMLMVQLLVDIATMTLLLYFTGGSQNPFVSLFLLPITVAAATLRPLYTWMIAAAATACYTSLMSLHIPMPLWGGHHADHQNFTLHIWGMWFGFMLSAGVVAYFVARMGNTLRAHDQALAKASEEALQANQLIALGSLAAGTAHQLGTPLGTVAILAKDMEHEHSNDPVLTGQLKLIREQINRCKNILSQMAIYAGQVRAEAGHSVALDRFLEETVREWRGLRPQLKAEVHWAGSQPVPKIIADRTLTQAIINILNNAADAAQSCVTIAGQWDADWLRLEIRDDGPGIISTIKEHLGTPFVTTKPTGKGMGLGLYLTQTTLNRLGGNFELIEEDGGVCARISLPLTALSA